MGLTETITGPLSRAHRVRARRRREHARAAALDRYCTYARLPLWRNESYLSTLRYVDVPRQTVRTQDPQAGR